jgi:hypothetical protein
MSTAYAGSLTIGAQINPGIKYQGGNTAIETMKYYVDPGDTKAFLKYDDKDITAKFLIVKNPVAVGVAFIKIKKLLGSPLSMTIGKQPTFVNNHDISITGISTLGNIKIDKIEAVTLGYSNENLKGQLLLYNDGSNPATDSKIARIAHQVELSGEFSPMDGVKLAVAYDIYLNADDAENMIYVYGEASKTLPVAVKGQLAYSFGGANDASILDFTAEVDLTPVKLIDKSGKPYFAVQYATGNDESGLDSKEAIKAGLKIAYTKNVNHNDYIKFTALKPTGKTETTTWEVGSDWVIKFAKTIK